MTLVLVELSRQFQRFPETSLYRFNNTASDGQMVIFLKTDRDSVYVIPAIASESEFPSQ